MNKNWIAFLLTGLFIIPSITFSQNKPAKTMTQIMPFKINVEQSVLDDLKARLKQTRWADEPKNAGWSYGTNPEYLRELVDYWQTKYNWRKQEMELNSLPQFKAEVDGVVIHFVHVKGKGKNPKPLILVHEWPDCFQRFYKVIPMLTDPAAYGGDANESFDVIVPSIPGYGFSDKVSISSDKVSDLFGKLMIETLGYKSFAAAGGFSITKGLSMKFPDAVTGIHLTDVGYPNGTEDWSTMSKEEQEFGQTIQGWFFREGAFNMVHSTKPQTLGYALNDSPVGLASWLTEKFYAWSDTKGKMENSITKDELLTNIMIYWVTQTINSSIRSYNEDVRASYGSGGPQPIQRGDVPAAVAAFPADSPVVGTYLPKAWAERRVNLKRFTKMSKGGRFAAIEVPELFVNDIRTFFWKDIVK